MTKVVPFERPAAYWASRARRHIAPDQQPDAARLLRKALEKTGDPALAMDLARIYTAMECTTAAERCLVRAVARQGLTGDACYLIGCCALNRGDEALAEEAFDACQRLDPDGACADLSQDALEMYPWRWEKRRKGHARSENMCRRARECLAAEKPEEAKKLAYRAWEYAPSPHAALLLGALNEGEIAAGYFAYAAREMPGDLRPRLLLSMALHKAGKDREADAQLAQCHGMLRSLHMTEDFCAAAWEMGRHREALDAVQEKLADFPASTEYLRLKYLCLRRLNDEENAGRTLQTLLERDPDDAAGLWYRRHPDDIRLYDGRGMLLTALSIHVYALPRRHQTGPLNRLLHWLVMALKEDVSPRDIYRLAPPIWRRLTIREQDACDGEDFHYPLALAIYILLRMGKAQVARDLYRQARGKRRLKRTLRRFFQWEQQKE